MPYRVLIEPQALLDIQNAIDYYDDQQMGLGNVFESIINKHFTTIQTNPFFQIRYDTVHCFPVQKFPFMIHYTVNEKENEVIIRAVLHTSLDPKKWRNSIKD